MTQPTLPRPSANQPIRFQRDANTGLVNGFPYRYTSDGLIDWRACVDPRFLYIAKERVDDVVRAQGRALADIDILAVKDDWLRIRVGGLNQLAHLRGVRSCTYPIMQTREGFASVVCELELIPNVESDMMPEIWSGIASACRTSMDARMLPYLETFAENRAFSRAVKRALQINILSDIEVGGDARDAAADAAKEEELAAQPAAVGFEAYHQLAELCRTHKPTPITFETLKAAAIKLNVETPADKANERLKADPATWTGFDSIQPIDAWLLATKIKEAAAKPPEKRTTKR
jgi:hypothetical protein